MRIGFSLIDLAMGGAQTLMVQLAEGLARRGHEIWYYLWANRRDTARMYPLYPAAPSAHIFQPLLARLEQAAQFSPRARILLGCDVIQLDGYHNLLKKLPYLPAFRNCVETYHSRYSVKRSGPVYVPHRIAISHAVQAELSRSSQVIHCGIPLPPAGCGSAQPYDVAILGRIHPIKQHLLFLEVCEQLFKQRGSLTALLIGGHPKPSNYQTVVDDQINRLRKSGLEIHLAGDVAPQDIYTWLVQVKTLLVTSLSEGFGRMAVEALACNVPVVANPVGGLLEIVQDGQNGFFARFNDPVSFVDKTATLLDNLDMRQKLGFQGRMDVENRFSLDAMLDAYEKLYLEIASRRS